MKLVALDTSTDFLSLAVTDGEHVFTHHERVGQKHAETALPALSRLLEEAGLALSSLDAVVYGQGPGSFTGLRIGCGLAQGLAFSANLPLIGIPTLDAVAAQAGASGTVLVAMDARMGQVYAAVYQDGRCQGTIGLFSPEALPLPEDAFTLAGDAWQVHEALLTGRLAGLPFNRTDILRPEAAAYLKLASNGHYPKRPAREAEVLYVRDKVALTASEQQARRT